jgi:hypothetical protein
VSVLLDKLETAGLREKDFLDACNQASDHFRDLTKRWENRFSFPDRSLVEQYQNGRCALICDLKISPRQVVADKSSSSRDNLVEHFFVSAIFNADTVDYVDVHDWKQEPMFIDVVKVVQSQQSTIPSIVRLYGIHDEVADCYGSAMYQSAIDGRYKFIPRGFEREFSVIVVAFQRPKNNLIDGVIQSRFEVVQGIANDKGKLARRRRELHNLDFENIISGLRIVLDSEYVKATYREYLDFTVKICDVMFGPFNL